MIELSRIHALLDQGEGLNVEFKTCRAALSRDVFESVCALLNRNVGELLLGASGGRA
jgi:ATP-dependent DNA helicase RecG